MTCIEPPPTTHVPRAASRMSCDQPPGCCRWGAPPKRKARARILVSWMQASRQAGLGRDNGMLCSDLPCPRQIGGSVSTSFRNDEGQRRLSMPPSTTCPAGRITEMAVQCRASYPVHSEPYTYARPSVAVVPTHDSARARPSEARFTFHPSSPSKGNPCPHRCRATPAWPSSAHRLTLRPRAPRSRSLGTCSLTPPLHRPLRPPPRLALCWAVAHAALGRAGDMLRAKLSS